LIDRLADHHLFLRKDLNSVPSVRLCSCRKLHCVSKNMWPL